MDGGWWQSPHPMRIWDRSALIDFKQDLRRVNGRLQAGAETSRSADYGSIDEGGEKSSRGSERATSFDSHALGTPEVMTEEEEKTSQARKVLYRSRVLGLLLTVGVLTGITMLLSALEEKGDVNWFGNWGHNRDVHAVTDLGPLRGIYQVRPPSHPHPP